jgi:ABC-type uncharacterized transport system auxiliary subunit
MNPACIRILLWIGFMGCCFFQLACAVKTRDIASYSFDYPAPERLSGAAASDTIMVYRFLLARSVPMDALVVTQAKGAAPSGLQYRWEENPADMITDLIQRDMQNSGLFKKAVDQASSAEYRYALEGAIKNLQGVIKDQGAKAVLEIDVNLTDFEQPAGANKSIVKKTYKIEVPSADSKPQSLIKAFNSAVREFSEQLRADVAAALSKGGARKGNSGKPIPHTAFRC